MVETLTGTNRSKGISYNELLDMDTHVVPAKLREDCPMPPGPTIVHPSIYYSRDFFDLEVERLWKRVWQMACHEDDIPNVGDSHVYDIANLSYIVVRTGPDEIKAFPNACLHRGRQLLTEDAQHLKEFRCPFHGWGWKIDGTLKEVPCQWDFPSVSEKTHSLPPVRVGRWGGFVFINPDDKAEPFEQFLGDIDRHFEPIPFERRYKAVHVAKKLRSNWKVAQEAFMEAYHVVATHPTLLDTMGDANSKYDVFGNMSRAISPNGLLSPHVNPALVAEPLQGAKTYARVRHALSGNVYERLGEDRVRVIARDGRTGIFDHQAHHLEGELDHADIQLCDWVGGRLPDGWEEEPDPTTSGPVPERRQAMAHAAREKWRAVVGDEVDQVSDAEFVDTIYYNLFPNISPWGCFNPIFYRFRPHGDNPEECIHEIMFMLPVAKGQPRPAPAKVHWLDFDDDYCDAPELGMLAKVFNQDVVNLPHVQKGMKSIKSQEIVFANYGETKIRHFHQRLKEFLGS
jgi:nitrite reductase/ring-hydroxylating ferredoxin subunit